MLVVSELPDLVEMFYLLVLVRRIEILKPDYFCGLPTFQNIPATSNPLPAADHARDVNKQVVVNETSSAERSAVQNKL